MFFTMSARPYEGPERNIGRHHHGAASAALRPL
jgi:hypothetical protein